ncbi:DUF1801 domain-containing protein [Sporosarcina ureae]|uniref:YdhG-like domain-containing protein n=1 Tax=Sporosarcina ureae TaxID=1571 RepID=A0ABM6JZU4_SPOUR|nr:DUF1801 domain-containing protein [Sporosarcina ureae]ARF15669.1 hypothetical protein SporoS204_05060 [Sporosarcina ureae]
MNKKRNTEEVDQFISDLPKDIKSITTTLRKIILESSPELTEEFKWSMPNYSYTGLVCYLQPAKKHVNLGFHRGNELVAKDENKLLQGTGKTMRHIRIKQLEEIQVEAITLLIKDAISLNENHAIKES